jgi:hypothetical protein
MKASQIPSMTAPRNSSRMPPAIIRKANTRPTWTARRIPRSRLPERHQKTAPNRRPPSSGNAGTRLKSPRATFRTASQTRSAGTSLGTPAAEDRTAAANATTATERLVSGPTAAINASEPADRGSPWSCETPPNIHRVMPVTRRPLRLATTACDSSWASRLAKKRTAPAIPVPQ